MTSGAGLRKSACRSKTSRLGVGDVINFQAVYTDGATRYNFQSLASQNYAMFGGSDDTGRSRALPSLPPLTACS